MQTQDLSTYPSRADRSTGVHGNWGFPSVASGRWGAEVPTARGSRTGSVLHFSWGHCTVTQRLTLVPARWESVDAQVLLEDTVGVACLPAISVFPPFGLRI